MGDGDMKTDMGVIVVDDAPALGKRVELHEGTVGDALQLIEAQRNGTTGVDFLFLALSIALRVDGKRFTVAELHAMPMRCTAALLRLGPRALEVNMFLPKEGDDADDDTVTPEPADPKS